MRAKEVKDFFCGKKAREILLGYGGRWCVCFCALLFAEEPESGGEGARRLGKGKAKETRERGRERPVQWEMVRLSGRCGRTIRTRTSTRWVLFSKLGELIG